MSSSDNTPQKLELLFRIVLQNLLLLISVLVFVTCGIYAIFFNQHAWTVTFIHSVASITLLTQWCHHGIRTKQIKQFIVELERDQQDTWEVWLPLHRPRRLLGSRWMISTKGVFLGTQMAMAILALQSSASHWNWAIFACTAILVTSAILLFTNPKE